MSYGDHTKLLFGAVLRLLGVVETLYTATTQRVVWCSFTSPRRRRDLVYGVNTKAAEYVKTYRLDKRIDVTNVKSLASENGKSDPLLGCLPV